MAITMPTDLEGSAAQEPLPDHIYPIHAMDALKTNCVLASWLMRFDDVLDTTKLERSLSLLLSQGDWRRLGGRLKIGKAGALEIHVPRLFSADQPAVTATKNDFTDMSIHEHELGKKLPEPHEGPYAQHITEEELRFLTVRSGFPRSFKDMIDTDLPQISLHMTCFKDATLVGLAWPHTLMDGAAAACLLRSWSLALAGNFDKIPRAMGAREDVLGELVSTEPKVMRASVSRCRTACNFARFLCHYLWYRVRYRPTEVRTVVLRNHLIEKIMHAAEDETAGKNEKCFVSEGDLLASWLAKIVSSAEPKRHPATLVYAVDARQRLPTIIEPTNVYLQNILSIATVYLSAEQLSTSTRAAALENRRQLAEQMTEPQVTGLIQEVYNGGGVMRILDMIIRVPDSRLVFINNYIKLGTAAAADFGPAVVGTREGKTVARTNPPGIMSMCLLVQSPEYLHISNCFVISAKDLGGNYWLTGYASKQVWARFEEALAVLG